MKCSIGPPDKYLNSYHFRMYGNYVNVQGDVPDTQVHLMRRAETN